MTQVSEKLQKENEELTRVGAGTQMGTLMRHYWLPAMSSKELVAGGSPVRLMLLGERLVAFRSPSGAVGVLDHRCPHRNASLFFGRNEEGGLRCIYHGWQFDTAGKCVDVPNTHEKFGVKDKVRAEGYRTHEASGVVWVYMGDQENVPALPRLEVTDLEEGDLTVIFVQRECNYLQGLEGDIDTSHLGFLHLGNVQPSHLEEDDLMRHVVGNRTPELEVADAPWGTTYCAFKETEGEGSYLRFANFLFPFWTQAPQGAFESNLFARAWVPMDDTHTMTVTFAWKRRIAFRPMKDGNTLPGLIPLELHPNTSDWYGRFRTLSNQQNDYLIDRDAQRDNSVWSGIRNVVIQDQAVTESMGEITDRSREHLAPSDLMISRTRRRLLRASRDLALKGALPPGVRDPLVYRDARSGDMIVPDHRDWANTYQVALKSASRSEHLKGTQMPQQA